MTVLLLPLLLHATVAAAAAAAATAAATIVVDRGLDFYMAMVLHISDRPTHTCGRWQTACGSTTSTSASSRSTSVILMIIPSQ